MNNDTEVKKYLNGFGTAMTLAIILPVLGILLLLFALPQFDSEEIISWIALGGAAFMILLGLFIFFSSFRVRKDLNDTFRELNSIGAINHVVADFNAAHKISSDKARLGNHYLYIKGSDILLSYDKIVQMYEYVHKTNLVVDQRAVVVNYINKDGKILERRFEVNYPLKNTEEPQRIMMFLLSKNPNIKVGYSKTK